MIKETLENRGVLGQIKARIRAEVFNSLDDHADSKPPLSNENMIINELIREYLEFNKYKYSASVLVAGRCDSSIDIYEPRCEKTGLRGFRPGPTQTRLYSHTRWLEA